VSSYHWNEERSLYKRMSGDLMMFYLPLKHKFNKAFLDYAVCCVELT
jgi:hypothetical protein